MEDGCRFRNVFERKRIKVESKSADLRLLDKVEGAWPAEREAGLG